MYATRKKGDFFFEIDVLYRIEIGHGQSRRQYNASLSEVWCKIYVIYRTISILSVRVDAVEYIVPRGLVPSDFEASFSSNAFE